MKRPKIITPPQEKKCSSCQETKAAADFYPIYERKTLARRPECKVCSNKKTMSWYIRHRAKRLQTMKAYSLRMKRV